MRIIPKEIFAMFNQSNRFFHCLRLWTQKASHNAPTARKNFAQLSILLSILIRIICAWWLETDRESRWWLTTWSQTLTCRPTLPKTVQNRVTEVKSRGLGTANNCFFVPKNRNPNVKKGKTENRSGYQNRKTGDFECKNWKTDLESDQNRETEKPNATLP